MLLAEPAPALRPSAADFGAIRNLLSECGLPTSDLTLSHLAHFRVVKREDELVGVGGLEPIGQVALVRSLAVAMGSRNVGLGGHLLAHIEREARRLKIDTLFLLTETAAPFFERAGYGRMSRIEVPAAVQSTREFSTLCADSAICLRKHLPASQ